MIGIYIFVGIILILILTIIIKEIVLHINFHVYKSNVDHILNNYPEYFESIESPFTFSRGNEEQVLENISIHPYKPSRHLRHPLIISSWVFNPKDIDQYEIMVNLIRIMINNAK